MDNIINSTIKTPPGFYLYQLPQNLLKSCTDEEAGQIIKAAIQFFESGEITNNLDRLPDMVYQIIISDIAVGKDKYLKRCEQNRKNQNSKTNSDE